MKKPFFIFLRFAMLLTFLACSTRIIRQTPITAIIEGRGETRIEAKMAAEEEAKSMFGGFIETQKAECSQRYDSWV